MSPGLPLNTAKKRQVRPPAPVARVVLTATLAAMGMQPVEGEEQTQRGEGSSRGGDMLKGDGVRCNCCGGLERW